MIGITKLYCGTTTTGDPLRYGRDSARMPAHLLQFSKDKKPVVVWNCSRRCNLHCIHCYADAKDQPFPNELTTEEGEALVRDLAQFGAPVLLFSGGEPLMREDIFPLARLAGSLGMRPVLSTNGTLISRDVARDLRKSGFGYVGISLDGVESNNDYFRGKKGAFREALAGFRNCVEAEQKVGLRLTLTKHNFRDLSAIFDLIEEEGINRACFYHLVYAGRGSKIRENDLTHEETRQAIDTIIDRTADFQRRGLEKDILTVDNHADGVYLYQRMVREGSSRAEEVLQLLRWNGGNSSGVGIGDIDNEGNVHADQFWRHYSFGNVRERPFSEIWMDTSNPIMAGLKNRKQLLKGRCGRCRFVDICNGNFRVRAEAVHQDIWQEDPACYLTEEELSAVSDPRSA